MRKLIKSILIILISVFLLSCGKKKEDKIPVVVFTDLYFPGQDAGDNFDIITPYALPEIDLKGVIFDVTEKFRKDTNNVFPVCREPGFISIVQLNYIFNTNVPAACSPFTAMRNEDDKMEDIPAFQQEGINLFLQLLEQSEQKIDVVSTGSGRGLAVAYNRNPELMKQKINRIHFCAGSSSDKFREWNIELDTLAAYRLLSSDLPINIYPCATENGPFDKGQNNTFWALDNLNFIFSMEEQLQKYLLFSLLYNDRTDYLNYLEIPLTQSEKERVEKETKAKWYGDETKHYVWETAVWQQVSGRRLAKQQDGKVLLKLKKEISLDDIVFNEMIKPCRIKVNKSGLFTYEYTNEKTKFGIYYRENPEKNEEWLREALPSLYISFKTK